VTLPESLELAPAPAAPDAPPAQPAQPASSPDAPSEMTAADPLAGFSGDTAYLRSADNSFIMMPNGRLQVDGYFYKRDTDKMPAPSFLLRRARLEVAGWVGPFFYNIAGDFALGPPAAADPVAQSWVAASDDFVGVAPWGNLAMLQVGQFDAPFTLENRTSDKYIDFMERSTTVRAFGIPTNKEVGAMVNGLLPDKVAYYSLGVFNGDGQNFRNVDSKFDVIGRAWVAPFAMANMKGLESIEIGGSMWLGNRGDSGLLLASQSTQGGFTFLDPKWKITPAGGGSATPVEVHQNGKLRAFAAELNVPIQHRFGFRAEYVRKSQELAADDATNAGSGSLTMLSAGKLTGWSGYAQAWMWLLGDDTILPEPGLELQPRLKKFHTTEPRHGVVVLAKVERIDETVTFADSLPSNAVAGTRKIMGYELGVNYWYSKRYRATFNYVINHLGGDEGIASAEKKLDGAHTEQEFLFRLAVAL